MRIAMLYGLILSAMFLCSTGSHAQQSSPPSQDQQQAIAGVNSVGLTNTARSSKIIGMDVYNGDRSIGQIDDILVDFKNSSIIAVIVSVGGFLGIGEKLVAVPSNQIKVDGEGRFFTTLAKQELTSAPAYHFGK